MTRDQSIAWIDALDTYLAAKRDREQSDEKGYSPTITAESEVAAREALVETMYPIVTGFRR